MKKHTYAQLQEGDAIAAEFDAAIAEDPIEVMAVLSRFGGIG